MPPITTAGPVTVLRGGEWLLRSVGPQEIVTPERLSEEHRLIGRTAREFVHQEVLPSLDRLEHKDWAVARRLVKRCGDLGLLGVEVAEAYGGLDLDRVTSAVVSQQLSGSASFGAIFGAQANLAILPLSLFGTGEQKQRYLRALTAGDLVGAYCLSEPGAGSDALGARTSARRQSDGSFLLNGEKTWITNGGFADLFIVFAKVIENGQEHFTAFLVERRSPGIGIGKEEHKMGLDGSSTTPIAFADVRVPAENVLGEVGKGHKVAFNVLNHGRFELAAMWLGAAHGAVGEAARYAAERTQFGRPIASFGAVKHKIGEMIARAYGVESALYRTAGTIDACAAGSALDALEEYAVEASIAKVSASEMLDFVLDENIQVHGGNGFVRDYPAERHYRDSRVNRIFEGTNEINRQVIGGMLARRAAKGALPIAEAAQALQSELSARPNAAEVGSEPLAAERSAVDGCRKAGLLVLGHALQAFGPKVGDEQEVLMHVANIMIDVYTAESAVLRAAAAGQAESPRASLHADAARVFFNDAVMRVDAAARQALPAILDGEALRTSLSALTRALRVLPVNTTAIRRRLADEAVARGASLF